MSRANLTVLVERDGELVTLGHSVYNGTSDQWATFIEAESADAWDRWYSRGRWVAPDRPGDGWDEWSQRCLPCCTCRTDAEPVDVMLYNDYGSGSWNRGIVCLTCMVITDIDVDETWDGRPEAGVAPSRRVRTPVPGAILTTATAADGSEPPMTAADHVNRLLGDWMSPPCTPHTVAGRPRGNSRLFVGVDPGVQVSGIVFVIRDEPFPFGPQSPELVARMQRGLEQGQENHPDTDSDPKDGAP